MKKLGIIIIFSTLILTFAVFGVEKDVIVLANEEEFKIEYSVENNSTKKELVDGLKTAKKIKIYIPNEHSATLKKDDSVAWSTYQSETVLNEGEYRLRVKKDTTSDVILEMSFEIDLSAPTFYAESASGRIYENNFFVKGTYYEKLTFKSDEKGVFFRINDKTNETTRYVEDENGNIDLKSGFVLDKSGNYTIEICEPRENGNIGGDRYCSSSTSNTFILELDSSVGETNKQPLLIIGIISAAGFVLISGIAIFAAIKVTENNKRKK